VIRRSLSAAILATLLIAGTQAAAEVKLSIRFFDKRIYFPGNEIPLMVTISNSSDATYRFKLADDRVYSLSFEARTPSNRLLDLSDGYKIAMSQSKPVFYRELAIKPGEEYSFKEGLERFIRVDDPGNYSIKAVFYPELASSSAAAPVASNTLTLSVRQPPAKPSRPRPSLRTR
jgi:P pilus assembly chaperone PapD